MSLKQKIFSVVTSIFIVLLIDQFFLHYLFPIKKAAYLKIANHEVQESLNAHPPNEDLTPTLPHQPILENRPVRKLTSFKQAAEECLGGTWSSSENLAKDLERTYGVQTKNKDIENYHMKIASGEERRIHITIGPLDRKSVRYFAVDDEGLPVPVPLKPEQRNLTPDQLIEELKTEGQIFLHQSKERWLLGNGSTFNVTFENDQAREFQIFGPSRTLSCLEDSCQCL
jgi:hypothetical protein